MEEDKLYKLFAEYNPELTTDAEFMHSLERKMRAVEIVKERVSVMKRKNRVAVSVAAFTGFAFGVVTTLCYPFLTGWISDISMRDLLPQELVTDYGNLGVCVALAAVGSLVTYCAYDITLMANRKFDQGNWTN